MPSRRAALGARGEDAVAEWYGRASYEVIDRNWRCAEGEIDLVARGPSGDVIVFCEVKTRTSVSYGSPFEAVTAGKRRRLRTLALRWLRSGRAGNRRSDRIRFDVAAVMARPDGTMDVEVLEDAF